MLKFATRVYFVSAAVLLIWAGGWMLFSTEEIMNGEALTIENPERDLGQMPVGVCPVTFRIENNSDQTHRIIGHAEG